MKPLLLVALLGCLASVFTAPTIMPVKWCVTSEAELRKCLDLARHSPVFSCVRRDTTLHCIVAIKAGEADAITVNGGDMYIAGLRNFDLVPIIAEDYAPTREATVAVVKKNSKFRIRGLQGKRSCHTGLGDPEGWVTPMGTLRSLGLIHWPDVTNKPLKQAVSEFFHSSCVPGVISSRNLCDLCKGDCTKSDREPFYGNIGAFKCLVENTGEVAFIKHDSVPDSEKANYELLCKDNTRAPIDNYKSCHLGRVPNHAVVSRKDPELAESIWTRFIILSGFNLFSSAPFAPAKNLMFTDSTQRLIRVPPDTDSFLYLGAEHMSIIRSLRRGPQIPDTVSNTINWCAVGQAEVAKCDTWAVSNMYYFDAVVSIHCEMANTVEECVKKIMRKEADAVAVDGGQVYTAGKCGLVPVMVEQYFHFGYSGSKVKKISSYYAVAVVKKGSAVNWDNLQGKRSCHSATGRSAGWNIPMGYIYTMTKTCDFTRFFSSGCAPGAQPTSPFCTQCVGSGKVVRDEAKCKPNSDERYYGNTGAFRCLVEDAGDVAFIKHTTVLENTDGNGPDWARTLRSADYELICPGKGPVPITDFASCNLARVPAHAVMARPESRSEIVRILQEQQAKFGPNGSEATFRMFQSHGGTDLLFTDSTKCLKEVQVDNYESFLGSEYMTAMRLLRECSGNTPDLENSCSFHTCQ
uniref:Serotransferrin n=1 Tax=Sphaeramia orbicularis TaxID=375764 RepID=A0A673C0L1_9TELE